MGCSCSTIDRSTSESDYHLESRNQAYIPSSGFETRSSSLPASLSPTSTGPTAVESRESIQCKTLRLYFDRLVNVVQHNVSEVAIKSFSKELISVSNKLDAENLNTPEHYRASKLLDVIRSQIEQSDAHFVTFIDILEEISVTSKLACELKEAVNSSFVVQAQGASGGVVSPGFAAIKSSGLGFQCPCGKHSLREYLNDRSKCHITAFPYLDRGNLTKKQKDDMDHRLICEADNVKTMFNKAILDRIFNCKAIQDDTPVNEIKSTVLTSAGTNLAKAIRSKHGDEWTEITTLSSLKSFLIFHRYINFFNYGILKDIVKEHCNESECQEGLDKYHQVLEDFCKRSVFKIPADFFDAPSGATSENLLVVKVVDDMWFDAERGTSNCSFTLRDIQSIQITIARVIGHLEDFIPLRDVGKGCLQLAFEHLLCQDTPTFPITISQENELKRQGIIIVYQPNLEIYSLPTETQFMNTSPGIKPIAARNTEICRTKIATPAPIQPTDMGLTWTPPIEPTNAKTLLIQCRDTEISQSPIVNTKIQPMNTTPPNQPKNICSLPNQPKNTWTPPIHGQPMHEH